MADLQCIVCDTHINPGCECLRCDRPLINGVCFLCNMEKAEKELIKALSMEEWFITGEKEDEETIED